ncbi:hypothetical protein [Acinetobacter bereziniae]|uniref:hypothetical protein n=1 Tax=Acinetobacter bereziniae TaxID=106648 RepID=UPI00125041A4|nr:hypothetical protein [Acinetobacter bereziniae]
MHKQIENLTIEQMREIVSGAPDWATHFNKTDNKYEKKIKVISLGFTAVNYSLACLKSNKDEVICLEDLRTAIAKHDTTDHVTDIRNHVSPSTKLVDL